MFKIVFDLSHLTFNDFSEFTKLEPKRAHHSYKLYVKGGKSWSDSPHYCGSTEFACFQKQTRSSPWYLDNYNFANAFILFLQSYYYIAVASPSVHSSL